MASRSRVWATASALCLFFFTGVGVGGQQGSAHLHYATLPAAFAQNNSSLSLPLVPTGLMLGMSTKKLIAARPRIKGEFGFFADYNAPRRHKLSSLKNAGLIETLPRTGFWETAMYTVEQGTLKGIIMVSHPRKASYVAERDSLLKRLLKVFGVPTSYDVVADGGQSPQVLWRRNQMLVLLSFSSWQPKSKHGSMVAYSVMTGEMAKFKPQPIPGLSQTAKERMLLPVKSRVSELMRENSVQ